MLFGGQCAEDDPQDGRGGVLGFGTRRETRNVGGRRVCFWGGRDETRNVKGAGCASGCGCLVVPSSCRPGSAWVGKNLPAKCMR